MTVTSDRFVLNATDAPLLEAALSVSANVTGHIAALTAQRDAAIEKAAAETVRADAQTVRANAAEDEVRELKQLLGSERGLSAYWHARCDQAEDAVWDLRQDPTQPMPLVPAEPVPSRRRRRRSR